MRAEHALAGAATVTLRRYMELCDVPAAGYSRQELEGLFTRDAVWQGVGSWNAERFGQVTTPPRIADMLESYLSPGSHFTVNMHMLGRGAVSVRDGGVEGCWPMVRLSAYVAGGSDITLTRLRVRFQTEDDRVLISRYEPRRLWAKALDPEQVMALAVWWEKAA
ncbi:hypothetical protein [Microtetraspora glauca]|uniref:Nuclear transport factor 2 family protein n=1 Tax=Microtetraspora glauca TaxID=1996 RepID=A0ABV3GTF4_MICGL